MIISYGHARAFERPRARIALDPCPVPLRSPNDSASHKGIEFEVIALPRLLRIAVGLNSKEIADAVLISL